MPESLIFKRQVKIVDDVELRVPTLGEIMEIGEEQYYSTVGCFIAQPFQYMAQLADDGIDYEEVTDFDLFIRLCPGLDTELLTFLFGDTLRLDQARLARDNESGELTIINVDDPDNPKVILNAFSLSLIADMIRRIHFFEKETRRAGNSAAKEFLIERARKKAKRAKHKEFKSVLEPLIIALVNAPEFTYTYESVQSMTIFQFMCSVQQIPRRLQYEKLLHGLYVGMIDSSKLNLSQYDWMKPFDSA